LRSTIELPDAGDHDEYTSKMGIVAEEADESFGWLEFIDAAGMLHSKELNRRDRRVAAVGGDHVRILRYHARESTP
jgi:hypothetical protein